ncbi:MAG: 30S ribosomal protein S8e [Candidatus Nezhaarchaeales archaeon]
MVWRLKDLKKPTGGRRRPYRKKRKRERGRHPIETLIGERQVVVKRRVRGGGIKLGLKSAVYANVADPETKEVRKVKVLSVKSNPASVDYSRRGVITKGALIETEAGPARVTSRPGQDGVINAIKVSS